MVMKVIAAVLEFQFLSQTNAHVSRCVKTIIKYVRH